MSTTTNNNNNNANPPSTSTSPSSLTLIKKGDYTVHILIEETKNLTTNKPSSLPLPVIKLTCFNKTHRTSLPILPCSDLTFNEHFYFTKADVTVAELDKSKLTIEVYDYNNSSKEDYLGIYELDIEYIYNNESHAMKNTWIALANPHAVDITKINGYLKLSVCVLHENDPRIELTPSSSSSSTSDNNVCLIPSQIKLRYKQLQIFIFKGEELPDDSNVNKKVNKTCQAYLKLTYMGVSYKTSVIEMKNDVIEWNEMISIGITIPVVSKHITFELKDKDVIGANNLGSFSISVDDILNNKYVNYSYAHVYGASANKSSDVATQMNTNSELGSRWKGRVLMKINAYETEKPVNEVCKVKDNNLIELAYRHGRPNMWTLYYKVYQLFYLPFKNKKYSLRISMQENSSMLPMQKAVNRNINYFKGGTLQCFTGTNNVEELPDVFITLVNDANETLCFQRLKAGMFHLNTETMVIKLIPEPSVGEVKDSLMSGLVKIKLLLINKKIDTKEQLQQIDLNMFEDGNCASNSGNNGVDDLEDIMQTDREAIGLLPKMTMNVDSRGEEITTYYTLIINVYMTRHMVNGDSDGTNDPYIAITIEDQEQKTTVKHNCLNGIWCESLNFGEVYFSINDKSTWPILFVKVMDQDNFSDDFLCYNYIWLSDMACNINNTSATLKPQWHDLLLSQSNIQQGQILLSAFILDKSHTHLYNTISILPETVNYTFELNVLGLRDIQPLSIIPVKKPYLLFDLNSINYNSSNNELQAIKTEPKDSGSNPNITSVIKFNAMLPVDLTYVPSLQCEVFDYILNGFVNKHLGIFELDIVSIINETNDGVDKDLKECSSKMGLLFMEGLQRKKEENRASVSNNNNQLDSREGFVIKNTNAHDKGSLKVPLVDNENDVAVDVVVGDDTYVNVDSNYLINSKDDLNKFNTKQINHDDINNNLYNSDYFIIKPVFVKYAIPGVPSSSPEYKTYYIEDEQSSPDDVLYFPLGYNKYISSHNNIQPPSTATNHKHYRRIFNTELEKVTQLHMASPFITCNIIRERFIDTTTNTKDQFVDNMLSTNPNSKILKRFSNSGDNSDAHNNNVLSSQQQQQQQQQQLTKSFGKFKAIGRICRTSKLNEYNAKIKDIQDKEPYLLSSLKHYNKYNMISKKILTKANVVIRVYILKLCDLAKKDAFSESDPYITISLGNTTNIINEKQNHHNDTSTVDWYKHYDIPSQLPGNGTLTISVYDYNPLFSDELIGSTSIDIEDRYFDNEWNKLKYKPIERRALYHPDYKQVQGYVLMFLEIFNKNDRLILEPWNIQPEPSSQLQCRFIVYETEDIACADVEETSDVYVIAFIDNNKHQSTDVHYRCQNGIASFNWRMVFDVAMPRQTNTNVMNVLVYDNDILMKDDYICGGNFNMKRLLHDANVLDMPIKFNRSYYSDLTEKERESGIEFLNSDEDKEGEKFWLQMYKSDGSKGGRVLCAVEVMPMWYAESSCVGKGRDEPNVNPYLPPPTGRISFTLNPVTMINQCVGPKFRKKIYTTCICCCLITYVAIIVPFIVYYLGGEIVNPFNYIKK